MNKDNEVLFEIKDYDYVISQVSVLISLYIIVVILLSLGANFEDRGINSFSSLFIMTTSATIGSFIFILIFYKDRKIQFYENKILLYRSKYYQIEIKITDVSEVYKLLPHNVNSNNKMKLFRWNILRKVIFIFLAPIMIVTMLTLLIGLYLANFIVFRSLLINRCRLLLVGKADNEFIGFYYTGNKELELNVYFRKKLGLEIKTMKPLKGFFIPQY